jgi:ribosomal protein L7/L12
MRHCPFCEHSVAETAGQCPKCGAALADHESAVSRSPALYADIRADAAAWKSEVAELVSQGHKIEAIKLYRERTGTGLKEAKDAVEAVERGEPLALPGSHVSPGMGTDADLIDLLRRGQKIEAIKLYRERTGTGLREAKEAVERLADQSGIAVPRAGCVGLLLLVLVPGSFVVSWLAT